MARTTAQMYHLNVFADSSKRFWWRSHMAHGTKLHPWGAPPITGLFAIAFEVPIDTTRVGTVGGKRFEVLNMGFENVVRVPDSDKACDLVYGGNTLVSFVPHNDTFKVSYENVGLKPGTSNIVHGFLVIETTVGRVKQIATKVNVKVGDLQVSVDVPEGADPDKIDEKFEQAVFQKEARTLHVHREANGYRCCRVVSLVRRLLEVVWRILKPVRKSISILFPRFTALDRGIPAKGAIDSTGQLRLTLAGNRALLLAPEGIYQGGAHLGVPVLMGEVVGCPSKNKRARERSR